MVAFLDVGPGNCDEFMSGQEKKFLAYSSSAAVPAVSVTENVWPGPYFNFSGSEKMYPSFDISLTS
jgi:hypothetical protein